MLREIILYTIIIFLLYQFIYRDNRQEVNYVLNIVRMRMLIILKHLGLSINFNLYPSTSGSYVENGNDIYIDVSSQNINLITEHCLHEFAHILCIDKDHNKEYFYTYQQLLSSAIDMGFLVK